VRAGCLHRSEGNLGFLRVCRNPKRLIAVPGLPSLRSRLASDCRRQGLDAIVFVGELVASAVQPAGQAAKVPATHPGSFGAGDRAAAVANPPRGVCLGEPGGLSQYGQPLS
jgi:hypothetical protein